MVLKQFLTKIFSANNFDNYPDAIIGINSQYDIVLWSQKAEKLFNYSKREIIGKNIGLVLLDETSKIEQCIRENKSLIISARNKSGEEIFVEITCNDNISEKIIAVRDITKNQKILEKLLVEYEKAANISQNKSNFISSLSHELRTPLHSIIGFSHALLDGLGGELSEKQEKYVNIISKNANNLLALLNNVLDISKIEAGKMEFNFKTFDVNQLINSVVESIAPLAREKKLEFELDLSEITKKNIYFDEGMLRQILLNIVSNAVKFTETGSISLKASHPDMDFLKHKGVNVYFDYADKSYLMISVKDTGIGISEEDLPGIFDEYRQLDRSMSKKYGGTGLGLAITRKIIHELGGVIWVESEIVQGSTFSFIIPIERPKSTDGIIIQENTPLDVA